MPDYRTIEISELIWNEWNVAHIARHDLTQAEVEEVCIGHHLATDTYGQRLLLIGTTQSGRVISVILDPEDEDRYFPVTARPASRKERQVFTQIYGKEIA